MNTTHTTVLRQWYVCARDFTNPDFAEVSTLLRRQPKERNCLAGMRLVLTTFPVKERTTQTTFPIYNTASNSFFFREQAPFTAIPPVRTARHNTVIVTRHLVRMENLHSKLIENRKRKNYRRKENQCGIPRYTRYTVHVLARNMHARCMPPAQSVPPSDSCQITCIAPIHLPKSIP